MRERLEEIVSFAELESFIDLPVRTYSSGMHMRLGFAIAVHVDADILLLDEVFAVGDEAFQRKCIGKILDFKERGGTVCFVSHSAAAVERLCERAIMLAKGEVEYDGPASEAIARYHQSLALEENPDEVGAGLREWGSGEVRVEGVSLVGADGEARVHFVSGEPVTIVLQLVGERPVAAPVLSLEVRDGDGSLLGADQQDWASSAGTARRVSARFASCSRSCRSARASSRSASRSTDAAGTRQYHRVDGAVQLRRVESSDHARGARAARRRVDACRRGRRVEAG